jgi:hypothetical protein
MMVERVGQDQVDLEERSGQVHACPTDCLQWHAIPSTRLKTFPLDQVLQCSCGSVLVHTCHTDLAYYDTLDSLRR